MQAEQHPSANPTVRKWWAMAGIGMGVFMSTLDAGIVNIALPTLVKELNTTLPVVEWVVLSYIVVITAAMLGVARLGDMLGKKKLYTGGLAVFTFGSLLCGLAPNVHWLIAFRALQGVGAVMTNALGTAIITEIFPRSERGRALGIIGSTVSVGIAMGPSLGGILIGLVGWRSVFLVNVPVGILTVFLVSRVVPASRPGAPGQRFDLLGAGILLVTLTCYALGMTFAQETGFGDARNLALLGVALVGLALFLFVEWRAPQPMVDLRLFANPLLGINLLMGFLVFVVMSGQFIMPFFLQLVKGYRTEEMGLLVAIVPVLTGVIAPISGSLSDRFGSRGISLIGLLMIMGGCLSVSTLHAGVTPLGYVLRLMPLGLGLGLFQSPNNSAIMGAAPRDRLGLVSGLLSLSRTLGQTTGMPLMGMLFTANMLAAGRLPTGTPIGSAPAHALVGGLTGTYRMAALGVLLSVLLAGVALYLDRSRPRLGRATEAAPQTE